MDQGLTLTFCGNGSVPRFNQGLVNSLSSCEKKHQHRRQVTTDVHVRPSLQKFFLPRGERCCTGGKRQLKCKCGCLSQKFCAPQGVRCCTGDKRELMCTCGRLFKSFVLHKV